MFFLAVRHLLSRKRQSLLTLLGIILGTAAYVAISGMMLGFQTFIIDQLVNNDAHIRISAREEVITAHSMDGDFFPDASIVNWIFPPSGRRDNAFIVNPFSWMKRLESIPQVAGYSEQLVIQAIINRAKISTAARLVGTNPQKQLRVTDIEKYMVEGHFKDIGMGGNRIVVGDGLLNKLGAAVHETISVSSGKNLGQPFKVVGSFHLGVKGLDESMIFGALSDVQKLNSTPSRISDIVIKLTDVEQAGEFALSWNSISSEKVQSWDQANEGIMSVFTTQDIVRNFMTISILIVAGFGIYNILSMAVAHKRKEIAILRSMGFESSDIVKLFLTQGVILGVIGGLVGCLFGFVVCVIMSKIPVSADRGLGGNYMMVSFFPMIYGRAFLLAFLSSSFASFLPSRSAGKLTPIDIIRSENS